MFYIDSVTIYLGLLILLLIAYITLTHFPPDIHPAFLRSQAWLSPTRLAGESACIRHRAVGSGELVTVTSRSMPELKNYLDSGEGDVISWDGISEVKESKAELIKVAGLLTDTWKKLDKGLPKVWIVANQRTKLAFTFWLASLIYKLPFNASSLSPKATIRQIEANSSSQPIVIALDEEQLDIYLQLLKQSKLTNKIYIVVLKDEFKQVEIDQISVLGFNGFVRLAHELEELNVVVNTSLYTPLINYHILNRNEPIQVSFNLSQIYASVSSYASTLPAQFKFEASECYFSTQTLLDTCELSRTLYYFGTKVNIAFYPVKDFSAYEFVKPTLAYIQPEALADYMHSKELYYGSDLKVDIVDRDGEINEFDSSNITTPFTLIRFLRQLLLDFSLKVIGKHAHLLNTTFHKVLYSEERSALGGRLRLTYIDEVHVPRNMANAVRILLGTQLVTQIPIIGTLDETENIPVSFGPVLMTQVYDYNSALSPLCGVPMPCAEFKVISYTPEPLDNKPIYGALYFKGTNVSVGNPSDSNLESTEFHPTKLSAALLVNQSLAYYGVAELGYFEGDDDGFAKTLPFGLAWLQARLPWVDPFIRKVKLEKIAHNGNTLELTVSASVRSQKAIQLNQILGTTHTPDEFTNSPRLKQMLLNTILVELDAFLHAVGADIKVVISEESSILEL